MRHSGKFIIAGALLMLSGCHPDNHEPAVVDLPPNTVQLSQMMRELSAQPGFTDSVVDELNKGGKKGPALLTPRLMDELRKRILGQYWVGLDHFPGWSMTEINPSVRIAGKLVGKSETASDLAAAHPGSDPAAADPKNFLDLGPYPLNATDTIDLTQPSTLPPLDPRTLVSNIAPNVLRGDGPNDLAPHHAESQRLADVLNRLSVNGLDGVSRINALWNGERSPSTPQELIAHIIETGHQVTVTDSRYFANFGHLHYKGQDVMMPFWVDSQLIIPHSNGRPLFIPVSHAEYEWHIRGPLLNADLSYYFGIDGKSQWRTMDTLDQAWVLKRNAHTYTGRQAVEVTRLAGLMTAAYMRLHAAYPALPFGGYYALGVCQDGVSAIEKHMTGRVTLFPNTADAALFKDPRDAEINTLFHAIPSDRDGQEPEPERIFGSLPADPGADGSFSAITIPGLAADLQAVHAAWTRGTLHRQRSPLHTAINITAIVFIGLSAIFLTGVMIARHRNIKLEELER